MSNKPWEIEQVALREALRELRESRDMKQQEVSDILGKPQSYVSKYETGERKLGYLEVVEILYAFEHTVEEFHALYLTKVSERRGEYLLTRKKAPKKKTRKKTPAKKSSKTIRRRKK